jgi:hypothetical protein
MWLKQLVFFLSTISISYSSFCQEKGTGPKEKSVASQRKINKQLRKEATEKRRKERAERKAIKAFHKRLQTKKVRIRMKKSKNKATLYNENRREPFYKRMFKKKRRR